MQVTFNPNISNRQCKKQNPAFGRVNTRWLNEIEEDACSAYNGTIAIAYASRLKEPHLVPDLKDTIAEALKKIQMFPNMRKGYEKLLTDLAN